jgi:hypothetical protein
MPYNFWTPEPLSAYLCGGLNPACPVKFFEEKERSEFNWGTSEPRTPEPLNPEPLNHTLQFAFN